MKLGVIADDFTGASDIALTIAEAGMTVAQFSGVPDAGRSDVDAGVVALKSRTAPVADAIAQSVAACDWLIGQGAKQIIFKVCSTFDSTPQGNIGPVLDALADRLGAGPVIVCPAFPENGRSVYMGQLFVGDVPLNESGMQDHPLTPMTDADLRRVLAAQSHRPVTHIAAPTVWSGADAIRDALPDRGHVIVDAIRDDDLRTIGLAALGLPLLCGGSGIALGLPANFGATPSMPHWTPVTTRGVVLSGSCSRATRAQVAAFRKDAPALEVTVDAIVAGDITPQTVVNWILVQSVAPLVYSSADPDDVAAAQAKHGSDTAARAIETLFADVARALVDAGFGRIVVAGGETSGAVVTALDARALDIGPRIAAGVPMVRIAGFDVALALKSGNFGDVDFFAKALAQMAGD
ncbi:3-oxo-tetronate kinase [Yoonia sp. 208BN28-4]|uniref:3-oxo-tetronate kinase n=1 Tax=Yoonia sp. 208BN28-4 TaxID=3126505 RepID=UPI00309B93BA